MIEADVLWNLSFSSSGHFSHVMEWFHYHFSVIVYVYSTLSFLTGFTFIFILFFTGHPPPLVQGQSLGPGPGQGHLSVLGGGGPDLSLLDPVFLEIIEPDPH